MYPPWSSASHVGATDSAVALDRVARQIGQLAIAERHKQVLDGADVRFERLRQAQRQLGVVPQNRFRPLCERELPHPLADDLQDVVVARLEDPRLRTGRRARCRYEAIGQLSTGTPICLFVPVTEDQRGTGLGEAGASAPAQPAGISRWTISTRSFTA